MQERNEKLNKLAKDVLILSRNTLLVNLRFLDRAISSLELYPIEKSSLMTDGQHILYNPEHVIGLYKLAKEIPARDYLHIIMHCVFRHMYMNPTLDRTYWDLACDIAVENVITELGIRATSAAREKQQEKYINEIKKELKYITAEKIYAYLKNTMPDKKEVAELRGLFYADNHEIWYMTAEELTAHLGIANSAKNSNKKQSPTHRFFLEYFRTSCYSYTHSDWRTWSNHSCFKPGIACWKENISNAATDHAEFYICPTGWRSSKVNKVYFQNSFSD